MLQSIYFEQRRKVEWRYLNRDKVAKLKWGSIVQALWYRILSLWWNPSYMTLNAFHLSKPVSLYVNWNNNSSFLRDFVKIHFGIYSINVSYSAATNYNSNLGDLYQIPVLYISRFFLIELYIEDVFLGIGWYGFLNSICMEIGICS